MSLSQKSCTPCKGGVPPVEGERLNEFLKELPEWQLRGNKIERKFVFKNFIEALDFVNEVGRLAEVEAHHPDISIHYKEVTILLWTHKINGLFDNDFILAAKIDDINQPAPTFSASL